jgi:hypothetical protein
MNLLTHALLRLQTLVARGAGRQRRATRVPASGDGRRNRFRPNLEPLEDRALLSHGLHSPQASAAMSGPSRLEGDCSALPSVFHGSYNVTWASTTQVPATIPRVFQVQAPPEHDESGIISLAGQTTFPFKFHHKGRTLTAVLSLVSIDAGYLSGFRDDPTNQTATASLLNQAGTGPATLFYTVEGGKPGKSNHVSLSGTVTFNGGLLTAHYSCFPPTINIDDTSAHFLWTATVSGVIGLPHTHKTQHIHTIVEGSWIWNHVNGM